MTDWKMVSAAHGQKLNEEQSEKQAAALASMEEALAELKKRLTADSDPASIFNPVVGNGQ